MCVFFGGTIVQLHHSESLQVVSDHALAQFKNHTLNISNHIYLFICACHVFGGTYPLTRVSPFFVVCRPGMEEEEEETKRLKCPLEPYPIPPILEFTPDGFEIPSR